jgi:hypothetical protein
VELRESRSERARRLLGIGIALLVAVAVGFLYLRLSERRGAPGCVQAYAAARTAADSALVDAQSSGAATGRLDAASNVSCGELRLRGALRSR